MTAKLMAALAGVVDEKSFLAFVQELIADREASMEAETRNPSSQYGPDAGGWENTTVDGFLEAAVAWAKTTDFGRAQGLEKASPWQLFANFLYCGKIYE